MVWVEPDGRILVRSDAALRVARYLGGWWKLALIGRLLPRPARDSLYNLIARHRHQLLETDPSCLLPEPEVRERFLDLGA
jgi:predicted DCC family thiol-disulfide oxidoreductase YuxK